MLEWLGGIALLGLTGNWRGYRMGGKAIGGANMSTDMKKKFEAARASGNMDQARAMADNAQEAKEDREDKKLKSKQVAPVLTKFSPIEEQKRRRQQEKNAEMDKVVKSIPVGVQREISDRVYWEYAASKGKYGDRLARPDLTKGIAPRLDYLQHLDEQGKRPTYKPEGRSDSKLYREYTGRDERVSVMDKKKMKALNDRRKNAALYVQKVALPMAIDEYRRIYGDS